MDKSVAVKPRWGRRIGIAFLILIVLLIVLFFVATSGAFLKSVILPRASKSLNAQITVDDASISPFSQVILKKLRVQTTGAEPLVTANEVRLRYSLMDIIKGHINVDEATLDTPTINLVKEADGSSNLDPLLKGEKKSEETKPSDKKPDLNIKNVALKNGTVRITQKLKQGGPNTTELTGVNVSLDQLKSGGPGKLTIASDLRMQNRPAANSNDVLVAKINGAYDFALTTDLAPQSVKGSTKIQVTSAEGSFKDAAGLAANLEADATPTQINQLGFRFEKSGQQLGQLRVYGPFDLAKTEGTLTVELVGIDKNILNIAGSGMDFGASTINSTNRVEVKNKATSVAIDGKLFGKQLGVTRDQKPTPPVDLDFDYKLAADLTAKTAALDRILLSARHNNAEFLTAKIDRPMNLSWGGSAPEMKESAFRLVVTNLNLIDWQAMLGTNPPSGIVNVGLVAVAQDNGKKLGLDVNGLVDKFAITVGTNAIENIQLAFHSKGTVSDLKRADLPDFGLMIRSNNAPMLSVKGNVNYDMGAQLVDLRQLDLDFTPTKRAENRITIQAKVDLSTNNPGPGNVSIKSPGLDLTDYYNMFAGANTNAPAQTTPTTPAPTATGTASADPNSEPAPINLPFKQFTSTVAIEKLFLREIAISNWNATMTISNNNVALNPLKLAVNGAPVTGNVALNLGVPGYGYDLALNIDRLPLEPFANSFATNKAGQYKGFLVADAKIRGAGTTGASLQKNLQGMANFSATNLDLQIVGRKWKSILVPISLALRVPEITQTPINFIDGQTQFGDGKISLKKVIVESEAFMASVAGDIPIDKVLTNSPLNLPVDLSLRRSLAQKSNLLPANTPEDARYASLPRFVTLKGTIGDPQPDQNKAAIAGLLARGVGGLVGGRAGEVLNQIGGIATGGGSSTNASATNASPAANLLQGLGGLLNRKPASTNSADTNSPAKNPRPGLLDLLPKK